MGGHEHHREGHKSSRSGAWEGFEKLKQALEGLATAKGVSQSRIGAVAKLAAHYSKVGKQAAQADGMESLEEIVDLKFVCSYISMWCTTSKCFCGRPRSSTDWLVMFYNFLVTL